MAKAKDLPMVPILAAGEHVRGVLSRCQRVGA